MAKDSSVVYFCKDYHPLGNKVLEEVDEQTFIKYAGESNLYLVQRTFKRDFTYRLDIYARGGTHFVIFPKNVIRLYKLCNHPYVGCRNWDFLGYEMQFLDGTKHKFQSLFEAYRDCENIKILQEYDIMQEDN